MYLLVICDLASSRKLLIEDETTRAESVRQPLGHDDAYCSQMHHLCCWMQDESMSSTAGFYTCCLLPGACCLLALFRNSRGFPERRGFVRMACLVTTGLIIELFQHFYFHQLARCSSRLGCSEVDVESFRPAIIRTVKVLRQWIPSQEKPPGLSILV